MARPRERTRNPGEPFPDYASLNPGYGTYGNGRYQASPEVSNMAESIASRAPLPAQTTNWNAWK
jgi:hypothetical protein